MRSSRNTDNCDLTGSYAELCVIIVLKVLGFSRNALAVRPVRLPVPKGVVQRLRVDDFAGRPERALLLKLCLSACYLSLDSRDHITLGDSPSHRQ